MKIRIELSPLASRHQSGVAKYIQLLSDALSKHDGVETYGHYFNFLNRQPRPELGVPLTKQEANTLIPLRVYAKLQSYSLAPAFDLLPPLKKSVDLTIFGNFATWPSLKTKKKATVIHDLTYLYYPEATEDKNLKHLRRVVPRSIKKADFIITVSESVKQELIKEFDIDPNLCIATPIPPDEVFFQKVSDKEIVNVKNKYGLDPDKKYIYFIGNLEPRKNLISLIRAYRALPDDIKQSYSLVLAGGKGWKTESTEAALKEAIDAGEDVRHLGYIDQIDSPALYQGASLFVMPSIYEGFGIPILEAMASGCPVVAADIPVLREVGSDCADYADTSDTKSFADAILSALSRKTPVEDLKKAAKRYSWSENVEKIIAAYSKS